MDQVTKYSENVVQTDQKKYLLRDQSTFDESLMRKKMSSIEYWCKPPLSMDRLMVRIKPGPTIHREWLVRRNLEPLLPGYQTILKTTFLLCITLGVWEFTDPVCSVWWNNKSELSPPTGPHMSGRVLSFLRLASLFVLSSAICSYRNLLTSGARSDGNTSASSWQINPTWNSLVLKVCLTKGGCEVRGVSNNIAAWCCSCWNWHWIST